jgi:hypothetical protein
MTFGLLGLDAQVLQIVEAARARGDEVVIGCDLPATLPAPLAGLRQADSWQALLDATSCDAVLVGGAGWNAARAEAVRTLVQAGRTLLLAQPLELSMLWAYELDMIRQDTGARLVPLLTARLHPFVRRLRRAIEAGVAGSGPLGPLESIGFVRRMPVRDRDAVLARLAADADLVRVLAGDPARLATLGTVDPDAAWSTLAVGFSGPALLPTRWQVAPAAEPGLLITLQHARGTLELEAPDDPTLPWTWSGPPAERREFSAAACLLDRVAGRPAEGDDAIPTATWADAARAVELAETVPRSLAKGRAIDLHREEFSELGTFRGTMASLGCGIVLCGLLVLVAATLVGGIANELDPQRWGVVKTIAMRIADAWPGVVLVVLAAFLALQILPLLVGPDRPRES